MKLSHHLFPSNSSFFFLVVGEGVHLAGLRAYSCLPTWDHSWQTQGDHMFSAAGEASTLPALLSLSQQGKAGQCASGTSKLLKEFL